MTRLGPGVSIGDEQPPARTPPAGDAGAVLRVALSGAGLSQRAASHAAGLSEKHMSGLINGRAPFTVDSALRIERITGLRAEVLLAVQMFAQLRQARERGC